MEENKHEINFERLFDILREEKTNEELQSLEKDFFEKISSYVKEYEDYTSKIESSLEKEKAKKQEENIKKMIKELYNWREKKIVALALDAAKTSLALIDTTPLLKEEKMLFDKLYEILAKGREGILAKLLSGNTPEIEFEEEKKEKAEEKPKNETKHEKNSDTKLIRFLCAVPKFVAEDLQCYGPFEKDDIARIPAKAADVLIQKERAEEIK